MKLFDSHAHCDDKRYECEYEGDCFGFCEKCDAEVRHLERELKKRIEQGHSLQLACISYPSFLDSLLEDAKNSINVDDFKCNEK